MCIFNMVSPLVKCMVAGRGHSDLDLSFLNYDLRLMAFGCFLCKSGAMADGEQQVKRFCPFSIVSFETYEPRHEISNNVAF